MINNQLKPGNYTAIFELFSIYLTIIHRSGGE